MAALGSFEYLIAEDFAPAWLQSPKGKALLSGIGAVIDDELIERIKQGARAHLLAFTPTDALSAAGEERQLERFPAMSDDEFRAYLESALTVWRKGGTNPGIIAALQLAFPGPAYSVINNRDWVPLPPDGNTALWSRIWTKIAQPHPFTMPLWGVGLFWGGFTYGTTATAAEMQLFSRIVKKWKGAHALHVAIIIEYSISSSVFIPVGD